MLKDIKIDSKLFFLQKIFIYIFMKYSEGLILKIKINRDIYTKIILIHLILLDKTRWR